MVTSKGKTNNTHAKPSFVSPKPESKPVVKERKPFSISDKTQNVIMAVACVLFAAFSAFVLIVQNSDVLYQAQNYSFFNSTWEYFHDCLAKRPGGLISWAASFMTQFYYHPENGACIQVAMWLVTMFVMKKAYKLSSAWWGMLLIPFAAMLISIVDVEYWLYYIKHAGYWFHGTIGFLLAALLTWLSQASKNAIYRAVVVAIVALAYPLIGWYSVLTVVYIIVSELKEIKSKESLVSKLLVPVVGIVGAIAVPLISYYCYSGLKMENLWTMGMPVFKSDAMVSITPMIPFFVLAAMPVIFLLLPKKIEGSKAMVALVINAVVACACVAMSVKMNYQNYNYHAEMRMYHALEDQDWDKILDEMSSIQGNANRQMVLMKNVALFNKGELGSKMFKYNNMGDNPVNDYDTLHVFMMQTGAPMLYLHHAKTNFAIRWCVENMVEYGPSYNNLKVLAQCSMINEEWDAARKYLTILQNTMYYKDWADKYMPIVDNPKRIAEYHEFDNIRELRDHMGTVLDGDQGLCEMYLLNYFSNTMNKDSKLLQELTLIYAMVQKDISLFWPRFFLYASMHKGEDMPVHYQEAAYLYGNLEHQVDISNMPFDKEKVISRYNGFQQLSQSLLASGMTSEQVGESMKSSYGDTFYWFYFFCREIKSY